MWGRWSWGRFGCSGLESGLGNLSARRAASLTGRFCRGSRVLGVGKGSASGSILCFVGAARSSTLGRILGCCWSGVGISSRSGLYLRLPCLGSCRRCSNVRRGTTLGPVS